MLSSGRRTRRSLVGRLFRGAAAASACGPVLTVVAGVIHGRGEEVAAGVFFLTCGAAFLAVFLVVERLAASLDRKKPWGGPVSVEGDLRSLRQERRTDRQLPLKRDSYHTVSHVDRRSIMP